MANAHAKCRDLSAEALESLQNAKPKSVSIAVRKLEICANLLGDKELQRWCTFHLGGYTYDLPKPSSDSEIDDDYVDRLASKLQELKVKVSTNELMSRLGAPGGGFESIEYIEESLDRLHRAKRGNDGTYYVSNLSKTISSCANAASEHANRLYSSFAFGDIPNRQFDVIRERVDDLLLDICPEAIEKFMSAYERLGASSSEDWSLALTACRRVIKAVADAIFPPTKESRNGRKLGEDQYINRLWAFLDGQLKAGSDKVLAKAHVDYLGSFVQRLNEKASKGVHATVSYEEAVRAVLYTYLTLGDILEFAPKGIKQALGEEGKVDINSASLTELQNVPGITPTISKEIIKRRAKTPFASVEQLLDIKGVGPKALEKSQPHLIALPNTQ